MSGAGFYHYDSMEQFLAVADTRRQDCVNDGRSSWKGNETYDISRQRCFTGNMANVQAAEKIIEQIEVSGLIKRGTTGYVQDVAGEFPLVPAYLAQDPFCMMRKGETELQTDRSPLRVFCDVGVSQSWSAAQLVERGTYLLALVMLLNERRAVELYWFSELGRSCDYEPTVPVVQIQTQPLDLSTASHVLASAGFFRNLCFAFNYANGGEPGHIPWTSWSQDKIRAGLKAEPEDLVLHHGHGEQFQGKPLEFLKHYLAQYAPDMLA